MGKLICNRNGVANPMNPRESLVKGQIFECNPHCLHMEDILNGMFSVYREPEAKIEPKSVIELTSDQAEQVVEVVSGAIKEAVASSAPVFRGKDPESEAHRKWENRFRRG